MRKGLLIVVAMLGACSPTGASKDGVTATAAGPAATIALAAGKAGECSAKWDGEPISADVIGDRALKLLMDRIEAIGGPASITQENMPTVRVEALPAMPWPCAATTIASLQRAGFSHVMLRPAGSGGAPERALQLPAGTPAPADPDRTIAVGTGGAVKPDGGLHDRPQLREFARSKTTGAPDDFTLSPSAKASFGDVYQTLIDLRVGGGGVMLEAAPAPPGDR